MWQQILITVVVVLVMLRRISSSLLISAVLPLGVLGAFIAMRYTGVDANIMALSGIAIAIGTMVDMGIVFTEAIVARLDDAPPGESRARTVRIAAGQVAPAVMTSTATTVIGFLPVFALTASEGKLFRPLAFTKTFAMLGALLIAMLVLPALAHLLVRRYDRRLPKPWAKWGGIALNAVLVVVVVITLSADWLPLGRSRGVVLNLIFVAALIAGLLGALALFLRGYERMLRWALDHKAYVIGAASAVVLVGITAWAGFDGVFGWLPSSVRTWRPIARLAHSIEGLGREYMPPFDEGAFLYMPTTMPHASIGQAQEQLAKMDALIAEIPEVDGVVGKLGRVDSPLDPAPVSMFETVVTYKPEYRIDDNGQSVRQWRDHIRDAHDIWREIQKAAKLPGVTDAPELMPIAARIVMLQSGMRAPMGLKIRGPDLQTIEKAGLAIEKALKEVPSIRPETVVADRIVGKPYLEIDIDREAIARHGISIQQVQEVIQIAIGGRKLTQTVEGRERYPVRVRYMRELRDTPDDLGRVLVPSPLGHQIPLEQLAALRYSKGPQVIKSEDTFLTGYVVFDKVEDMAEVDAVEQAKSYLETKTARGELELPEGVSYAFAGSYENQLRSEKRLGVLVPLAIALIVLLIYLQFRRLSTTLIIFSGVALAVSGGFILIWLYGKPWFLDVGLGDVNLRDVFRVRPTNMSVAVWVGFIALVGIATDDGVVLSTYLHQLFDGKRAPTTVAEVKKRVLEAGCRRSRACIMTTATTILALLPVVTATGRGADVMLPMALPALGGMTIEFTSLFLVPVLFSLVREREARRQHPRSSQAPSSQARDPEA